MITIDGSHGEAGGQIVRTALALSALTQKPFEVSSIRSGRPKPGLKNQHLYCIRALKELTDAEVEGAELGSTYLKFIPKKLKQKSLKIDIETAGSISLFMQALLLPCCFGTKKIKLEITGGTDAKFAMPIDFFTNVLVPHYKKLADIKVKLNRRGYFPKGNGNVVIEIAPKQGKVEKIDLTEQPTLQTIKGIAHASKDLQKKQVAERIAKTAKHLLKDAHIRIEYQDTLSTGTGIVLWAVFADEELDFDNPVILGADSLGELRKSAEMVGEEAANRLLDELNSGAAVDRHTADNLIPLLGLLTGSMKVSEVTEHTKSNIWVTEQFLGCRFEVKGNIVSCSKIYK